MLLGLAPLSHLEFISSTAVGELPHACIFSFLGSAMKLTGTFSFESPPIESAADTALLAVDGLLAACSVLICFAQAYRWLEDAVCLFDAGANVNSVHAPAAAPAQLLFRMAMATAAQLRSRAQPALQLEVAIVREPKM